MRRLPIEGIDLETSANLQRVLARSHEIFSAWFRIYMENVHLLKTASTLKWTKSAPLPVVGDVVLFVATESAGGWSVEVGTNRGCYGTESQD